MECLLSRSDVAEVGPTIFQSLVTSRILQQRPPPNYTFLSLFFRLSFSTKKISPGGCTWCYLPQAGSSVFSCSMLESSPRTRDRTRGALGLAAWSLGYWTPGKSLFHLLNPHPRCLLEEPYHMATDLPMPLPGPHSWEFSMPQGRLRAGAEATEKERKWDSGPHCGRKARKKKQTGP